MIKWAYCLGRTAGPAPDSRGAGSGPFPWAIVKCLPLGNNPTPLMLHVGSARLDRKQRAACAGAGPAGAGGGRLAGRALLSSGEFREGLLSLGPSRGNFGDATCARCGAGARGGGGVLPRGGRPRGSSRGLALEPGRRVPRRPRAREGAAARARPAPRGRSLRLGGLWIRL